MLRYSIPVFVLLVLGGFFIHPQMKKTWYIKEE